MHTGGRRIARVVLLSVAAGVALAEGDVKAAIDHGRNADDEATELGVEREVPLIRAVLARSLLADGQVRAAAERAAAAIAAARSLSFDYPFAIGFETAALVLLAADGGVDVAEILGAAADLRERGSRPAPPTLRAAVDEAVRQAGLRGRGPLDRARLDRVALSALDLLHSVTGSGR